MPPPFPGMDPYLERSALWPGFHHRLVVEMANRIEPLVRPRYHVEVEQRLYAIGPEDEDGPGRAGYRPDLTLAYEAQPLAYGVPGQEPGATPKTVRLPLPRKERELYLEVRDGQSGAVVCVLEILSPASKGPGEGRRAYLDKRAAVFSAGVHLVEIDLLRAGRPMPSDPPPEPGRYSILVARADRFPQAQRFDFGVREPIPVFGLPLGEGEPEPAVSVRAALEAVYDHGGYGRRIDYSQEPPPPLSEDEIAWVRAVAAGVLPQAGETAAGAGGSW